MCEASQHLGAERGLRWRDWWGGGGQGILMVWIPVAIIWSSVWEPSGRQTPG